MSVISLPAEILQRVRKYATSLSTLNAVSRANRRFNSIFDPLLYMQDARRAHSLPVSAGGAAAVRWGAKHGLMRTLQKSLEAGSEVPLRAPWMSVVHEPTGRTVYGVTIDWRFQDPVPPPHPLCLAVQGGHAKIVEFFLDEKGCEMDMCDSQGMSLLEQAVVHGHVQIVEGLLRRGASQLGDRGGLGRRWLLAAPFPCWPQPPPPNALRWSGRPTPSPPLATCPATTRALPYSARTARPSTTMDPQRQVPCFNTGDGRTFQVEGNCWASGRQFHCLSDFGGLPTNCDVRDANGNVLGTGVGQKETTFIGISIRTDASCVVEFDSDDAGHCPVDDGHGPLHVTRDDL